MTTTDTQGAEPLRVDPLRVDPLRVDPILLAFSGGLDTSFCVPWLKETYRRPVITVTVDTGGLDAAAAAALAKRSAAARRRRASLDRCAQGLFRPGAQILDHGQCPARRAVSAVRRRRARAAGADHCADGAVAQVRDGGARLHRRRQRSGAFRSGAAHSGTGAHDHRAGARSRLQARGAARVSRARTDCRFRRSARRIRSTAGCGASPSAARRR